MKDLIAERSILQPPLMKRYNKEINVAIASLSLGGAERIVLDWAVRIHPHWKVHLIVLRDQKKEWIVPDFIRVTRLHGVDLNVKLRNIGKKIASSDNPVCVCHLLRKNNRDSLVKGGAKVVAVLHNARNGWLEGASNLSGVFNTIAVSKACLSDLRNSGWNGSASVIRHLPSVREFRPDARSFFRKQWKIPENACLIGMIGAVKPQKNYELALEVLKELLKKRNIYLVIIGGPVNTELGRPAWNSLVGKVYELGLRKRVSMPGYVPDAESCLPAFDLMLNTSHYEGLSIATLEALVYKMPVVASKVGGQGEVSSTGLTLLPENSPVDKWASAIENGLSQKLAVPSWLNFPSFRLWTLAGLAYPFKPKQKTIFITANLNSGGAQRSLVNLSKELKGKYDFEIVIAGDLTSSYFYEELIASGVSVSQANECWNVFAYAENIIQKICKEKIGSVCFWNLDARIKLLIMKALSFSKVHFTDVSPGDYIYEEMSKVEDFQELIAFYQDEYFKRINSFVLKYKGDVPDICSDKTFVIPNGVPIPRKEKYCYNVNDIPKVVVNGRIAPSKYLFEIFQAMKLIWQKIPNAQLHIYGAAEHYHKEYAEEFFRLVGEEKNKRVFFHGLNFKVVEELKQYDVYVVLGKNQGCPNSLLEAMSVGLPCIANDDGGTREQLINNETGILVSGYDPQELAEAMFKMLINRSFAKKCGENARLHVKNNFSMRKMSKSYTFLFKRKRKISLDLFLGFNLFLSSAFAKKKLASLQAREA